MIENNKRKYKFEPLGNHDRAAFSCGNELLDRYLKTQASQDVKKRAAVAFVMTSDGKTIAGFYTLSQYSIELDKVPDALAKKLAKYPQVPITLIGRLGVAKEMAGQGLGELLLMDALYRAFLTSSAVASAAVVVDAKDEKAIGFYKKYGFLELPEVDKRLFLPMTTIAGMFT